jgi:formate--tetrahydrofolate ligase
LKHENGAAPTGFTFPSREARASAVAGFIYPLAENMTIPALGSQPSTFAIDIDEKGNMVGLF